MSRSIKHLLTALIAVLVITAATLGGFFGGQNTRASGTEVGAKVSAAVSRTVAQQKLIRRKALRETRAAQKRHDARVMHRLSVKLTKLAERKSAASYQSGQSTGYASGNADGYSSGTTDGLIEGSDDLTCSDDPDVEWLPACSW
jgi:xanthine dehydrogenase molybdopterin-binding subunit B